MIIDPDHLSVLARDQLLAIVEAQRYSGIVVATAGARPTRYPRIYSLGGVVTPYAGVVDRRSSTSGKTLSRCATRATTSASAGAPT